MIAEAGLAALWLAAGLAGYQFLLTIIALRGSSKVTAHKSDSQGDVAFDGTVAKADGPVAIRGAKLWVYVQRPKNLRFIVNGHTRVIRAHRFVVVPDAVTAMRAVDACTAGSALVVTSLLRVGAAPAVPREAPA